jgi:RimJ/RimL family protein N-acetyltransferase
MADGGDGVGVAISEAAHCHQRSRHQRSAIYNRARMSDRTERAFAPEPREPSRRRFMIAGEHVILRAFEREDIERCYRWMNDPNIVRTLKSRYPIAFQNETEWLESAIHLSDAERHFAIERRDDRTHIGNASIHDIDWVSRTAAFGLFIGEPSAWNRGFGSDAIATLVRFAFEEMNLRKLHINVFDYNDRAKHVLETHGFVQEGRLQKEFYREGAYHDIVILSIFRDAEEKSE